jgi:hypothetical protein
MFLASAYPAGMLAPAIRSRQQFVGAEADADDHYPLPREVDQFHVI